VAYLESLDPGRLAAELAARIGGETTAAARWQKLTQLAAQMRSDAAFRDGILAALAGCHDLVEDQGHTYGATLGRDDKLALIAFLKTL
jgi:hypothetical protein